MNEILQQINNGKVVCPVTGQRLIIDAQNSLLRTIDGAISYPLLGGTVPLLLQDRQAMAEYVNDSAKMTSEYTEKRRTLMEVLTKYAQNGMPDFRKRSCPLAFNRLISAVSDDAICLSIGGGPTRAHPRLLNLNIGPFQNVEIVADAHLLPYADNSVDFIYCGAVLEHLYNPQLAVSEMFRILKPGGSLFAETPFLQAYHGYPHHYQNFTLTGHEHLFRSSGFHIRESGPSLGPLYTGFNLISKFIKHFFPKPLVLASLILWNLIGLMVRPLDLLLNEHKDAYVLASATYLAAEKVDE